MQLTAFAWIFVPLLAACLALRRDWLPALVTVSAVPQAAAVLDVAVDGRRFGITAYSLTALACGAVLAARLLRERAWRIAVPRATRWLLAYAAIAVAGAFVLPHLFAGVPVYTPLNPAGFDADAVPLAFSLSNVAQAVNLCAHVVVLAFLLHAAQRSDWTPRPLLAGLAAGALLVLAVGGYERIAVPLGLPSTTAFWTSNPGYLYGYMTEIEGIRRISLPFTEPSYASAYLAALLTGLLAVAAFGARRRAALLAAAAVGLALLNTFGITGWLAAAGGAGALLVLLSIGARGDAALRRRALVAWLAVGALAASLAAAAAWRGMPAQLDATIDATIDAKLAATQLRQRSNAHALALVADTYGLGVGLGSNRASSYLASLAGATGIPGVLAFAGALLVLARRHLREPAPNDTQRFALGCLGGATLAVAIGIPDLNMPFYWVFVCVAWVLAPRERPRGTRPEESP